MSTGVGHGANSLWADVGAQLTEPLPAAPEEAAAPPIQQRRRRAAAAEPPGDPRAAVRLVRDEEMLRWVYEPPLQRRRLDGARRAWRSYGVQAQDTVQRIAFRELGANQLTQALVQLDERLNPALAGMASPAQGLRRWDGQGWAPLPEGFAAALQGRVLVLVHGTFSASAMYAEEFAATDDGRALFERLQAGYAAVLAFDHATLSVAPWLNALALRDALAGCGAELDVVGHSRGGLVLSWLLRLAPTLPVRQALFVGSPLAGTSLAAPDRIRQALDTLASLADALAESALRSGAALPPAVHALALGVGGLACVVGRVLQLGARLPLADAAVGLVPGLLAQARVSNNLELAQLYPLDTRADVQAIGCSFRPSQVDEPVWKVWKRIANLKGQAMYYGADLIFDQPNDLVVDHVSMQALGGRALPFHDLGTSATTHHCNYFQDRQVLAWLDQRLR